MIPDRGFFSDWIEERVEPNETDQLAELAKPREDRCASMTNEPRCHVLLGIGRLQTPGDPERFESFLVQFLCELRCTLSGLDASQLHKRLEARVDHPPFLVGRR